MAAAVYLSGDSTAIGLTAADIQREAAQEPASRLGAAFHLAVGQNLSPQTTVAESGVRTTLRSTNSWTIL